jgi:hypothetical protein
MTRKQVETRVSSMLGDIANLAESIREFETDVTDHIESKSENWQDSDKGQAWEELRSALESLADAIDCEWEDPDLESL